MKIKHHFNYVESKGLAPRGPVETIQGQSQTVAEMLQRLQAGLSPNYSNLEYPENENDFQIRFTDPTDIDKVKHQINAVERNIEKRKKELELAAEAARLKEEEERRKKEEPKS